MEETLKSPLSGFSVITRVVYLGSFHEIYSCRHIISITACAIAGVQREKSSRFTIDPFVGSNCLSHIGTAYPILVSSEIVHPFLIYSFINSEEIHAHSSPLQA